MMTSGVHRRPFECRYLVSVNQMLLIRILGINFLGTKHKNYQKLNTKTMAFLVGLK